MREYKNMKRIGKGEVTGLSKDAPAKSPRFVSGIPRACHNPLCRSDFILKRKDQRFCCRKCKESFYKVKYAILVLAPYFNVDTESRETGGRH